MALICFDLDGTLLDPLDGVASSLAKACAEAGVPCPTREAIARSLGLDPARLFPGLSGPELRNLMERFRRWFGEEGLFAQQALEGTPLMLARLKRQGHQLQALASQPLSATRRALHHLDLNLIFDDVAGPASETWTGKAELLEVLRESGLLEHGGYLVGDRGDDLRAARAAGLTPVGAGYGYGERAELESAEPAVIVDSVPALDRWLAQELKGPEIHDPFDRSE